MKTAFKGTRTICFGARTNCRANNDTAGSGYAWGELLPEITRRAVYKLEEVVSAGKETRCNIESDVKTDLNDLNGIQDLFKFLGRMNRLNSLRSRYA